MRLLNLLLPGWRQKVWDRLNRPKLGGCGENVDLPCSGSYTFECLYLGNNIVIGQNSLLWAAHSKIMVGDKVITGPEIVIMAGDHNVRLIGKYMADIGEGEKGPGDDQDVVIEGDNWIGARTVILKGVRIGRGAVIGAGAVLRRRVPPYTIVAGNPARPYCLRGTVEEIMAHEAKLYPPEKRLPRATLEAIASVVWPVVRNS